ncbi:DUF4886 domain-containing protein [Anaerocolumna sp. MB42-C2]|uniref:DUF4886 domain-containing protein n=1 Tax=Anaerocolumna sp. MB42-C2 TaxID=3070997 RepID=UPI0027E0C120|nr:DUF4886 domain-containing protein [Anaerocolumna sp. MB42-C2]WMJ90146.1 DUF4886 domain-containing protein [Anaerocolumna sp. MB42-C2]
MIKILCIGNSFSQDSTTYLFDLAKTGGIDTKVVNLYIGGCSLERHWDNITGKKADYEYQLNGVPTGKYVTIKEVLTEEDWDIVTMQQCSGFSGLIDTYHPYSKDLSAYVSQYAPKAKQLIHQTWAYEIDSDHSQYELYHRSQEEMYQALRKCYSTVAQELSLDIIPFGEVIQKLRTLPAFDYKNGGKSLCRDGFHMHYLYGRYALAATWYEYVIKGNLLVNNYLPPRGEEASIDKDEIQLIKACIHDMVNSK